MPVSIARRSLHAAATDPHNTLRAIARTGDAKLFDLLLDRTHIKTTPDGWQTLSDPYLSDPLTLRGLIALAPTTSARAQTLRSTLTDLLLRGDTAEPSSNTLRYLDRFPRLQRLRLEGILTLSDWESLAGHPALTRLELELCGLSPADLAPLARTRLQRLEVRGLHPLAAPVQTLSIVAQLSRLHTLHLRGLPHLSTLPDLSALSLDELRLVDLPALEALPPLPDRLATLWAPGRSVTILPPALRRLRLIGPTLPELAFPDSLEHLGLLLAPGALEVPELPTLVTASLAGCVALSDLSPLSGCLSLRWLDLRGCAEVRDLSALSALPELTAIATAGTGMELRSLPAALRRKIVSGWSPDLDSESRRTPRNHPPLVGAIRDALLQIRALLRSNDTAMVEQALELIFALDEPPLYDALLRGSGLTAPDDDGFPQLRLSGPFAARNSTDQATRRMRWALMRVLSAAPTSTPSARFRAGVEALSIDCPLLDVHDLSAFSSLKRLSLRRVRRWRRADQLATMAGLEELFLHNSTLPTPAAFPPNLKVLKVSGASGLVDLTCLSGLDMLEEVELVQVSGLERLAGLPASARRVDIRRAEVLTDVGALGQCAALEQLSLSGCVTLTKLGGLSDRQSLRVLRVRQAPHLTHLTELSGCDALEEVELVGCVSLRTLDGLQDARGLRALTLHELPALTSLDAVENADLVTLSVEGCVGLRGLTGLSGSRSLRSLELSAPQLTSLVGLEGLDALQSLRLTGCTALTDLRALSRLPALESVSIRGSGRLVDLSGLPPLRELVLCDIGATDLSPLPAVYRLVWDDAAPLPLLESLPTPRLGSLRLKRALVDPSTLSAALAARVRWVV
ncbi:MAG: hypothetical protein ACI8S6_000200 [Myxococcota bacterium]|jgi:hypothetical protein